ncbi:MAG TPA: hypothetical protein VL981_07555 [Candidatus Methylacidiphilales bacterium]|nr:hypothetical protein [Candidatus Methylacidiphilales bacterium]
MAKRARLTGGLLAICLMLICLFTVKADPEKTMPEKDFLVASGLTEEAVTAIKTVLQSNKIPFTTEDLVGQGERFVVSGAAAANQAFALVKSLKPKFSEDALTIPDKPIGRTQLDRCAIGLTYDLKAWELIAEYAHSQGLPLAGGGGDSVTGYSIECKKETGKESIAMLHAFAKLHSEMHIQIFDQPYPVYSYDEPVPSVDIILH